MRFRKIDRRSNASDFQMSTSQPRKHCTAGIMRASEEALRQLCQRFGVWEKMLISWASQECN